MLELGQVRCLLSYMGVPLPHGLRLELAEQGEDLDPG